MIRTIEELSMNAWPALQTLLVDGWVLRFADGYTRRANAIYPLYPAAGGVGLAGGAPQTIEACQRQYRARGLPVIFKMTAACCPAELDDLLAARGYQFEAHTSVQLADLARCDPAAPAPAGLILDSQPTLAWQDAFARMHGLAGAARETHRRMLDLLVLPTCCAMLEVDGEIAACGLAVRQEGYIGLFDIITAPAFRRRGCAGHLLGGLLAWGRRQGAHTAYLQVMLNNPPALRLYEKLGFREAYRYWYRVSP
jgi:ribosomal protein S18 acetylase RimI-like enzyme